MQTKNNKLSLTTLLLRIGLGSVFLYAGVAGLLNPLDWIGFIPEWTEILADREALLFIYSICEIILGVWLFSGLYLFYAAVLSSLLFLGIIITSTDILDVTFRDIGLFFTSLALMVLSRE